MSARFARPFAVGGAVMAGALLLMSLATQPTSAAPLAPSPSASWSALPQPTGTPTVVEDTRPKWRPAPCATGDIGPLEGTIIPATITLCGAWQANYSFSMVSFPSSWPVGFVFPSALRPYAQSGPTTVQGAFVVTPTSSPVGVCLMRSLSDRIACVRIDVSADQRLTATPLPTDDPLVAKPVQFIEDIPGGTGGVCATCLGLPSV